MKRPSFQFYPADWNNNQKLRTCSDAARGAWVDVLCFLHDCEEYGVARMTLAELAKAVRVDLRLLKQLANKKVLKGDDHKSEMYEYTPVHSGHKYEPVCLLEASDGPCWYSSRFVRDEWLRARRGANTRFSADNQPSKNTRQGEPQGERHGDSPTRSPGTRQGDGASSSSSSSIDTSSQLIPPHAKDNPPPVRSSTSTPRSAAHSIEKALAQITEQAAWPKPTPVPESLKTYLKAPKQPEEPDIPF